MKNFIRLALLLLLVLTIVGCGSNTTDNKSDEFDIEPTNFSNGTVQPDYWKQYGTEVMPINAETVNVIKNYEKLTQDMTSYDLVENRAEVILYIKGLSEKMAVLSKKYYEIDTTKYTSINMSDNILKLAKSTFYLSQAFSSEAQALEARNTTDLEIAISEAKVTGNEMIDTLNSILASYEKHTSPTTTQSPDEKAIAENKLIDASVISMTEHLTKISATTSMTATQHKVVSNDGDIWGQVMFEPGNPNNLEPGMVTMHWVGGNWTLIDVGPPDLQGLPIPNEIITALETTDWTTINQ